MLGVCDLRFSKNYYSIILIGNFYLFKQGVPISSENHLKTPSSIQWDIFLTLQFEKLSSLLCIELYALLT